MSEPSSCERCGERFGCGVVDGDCWCVRVPVSEAERGELAREYRDCLCPTCLRELASGAVAAGQPTQAETDGLQVLGSIRPTT
jgi:hypothetical protein